MMGEGGKTLLKTFLSTYRWLECHKKELVKQGWEAYELADKCLILVTRFQIMALPPMSLGKINHLCVKWG